MAKDSRYLRRDAAVVIRHKGSAMSGVYWALGGVFFAELLVCRFILH